MLSIEIYHIEYANNKNVERIMIVNIKVNRL